MRRLFVPCALAALAASLSAQDFIGFSYNTQVNATSRGTVGAAAGECMTRIDGSEYAGWGTDVPGSRTISSIFFVFQDQLAQPVANTLDIILYPEDPALPNRPLTTAPVVFALGVTGPTGTGTIAAVGKIVTPAVPVAVPITPGTGGDVFVSFRLGAVTATANTSVQVALGYQAGAAFTTWDLAGPYEAPAVIPPALPVNTPQNTHGLTFVGGVVSLNNRRNQYIDVAHSGTGGAVLTITNQATCTPSNNPPPAGFGPAPGTADFQSGVAPDINGFNPGRADDITFDFFKTGIGVAPVFFLMDLSGGFAPIEVPISTVVPGSGVICINASATVLGLVFSAADEAFITTTIPAGLRPFLGGLVVVQQAAAIDAANNVIMSPCGAQRF